MTSTLFNKFTDVSAISESDGHYIAGFVDGEGYFGLHAQTYGKKPKHFAMFSKGTGGGYWPRWTLDEQRRFCDFCQCLKDIRKFSFSS